MYQDSEYLVQTKEKFEITDLSKTRKVLVDGDHIVELPVRRMQ